MKEIIKSMQTLKNHCENTKHCSECCLEYMCEVSPIFWVIPEPPLETTPEWKKNLLNRFMRSE